MANQFRVDASRLLALEIERTGLSQRGWIESRLKIYDKRGDLVPLLLNDVQQHMHGERMKLRAEGWVRRVFARVLKPRQVGSSTYWCGVMFEMSQRIPGFTGLIITHHPKTTGQLRRIMRVFYKNLPEDEKLTLDFDNKETLAFEESDSRILFATAGEHEPALGHTIHFVLFSEVASYEIDPYALYAAVLGSIPFENVLIVQESTAKGAGGAFFDWYHEQDQPGRLRFFFPWWLESEYTVPNSGLELKDLTQEERRFMKTNGVTLDQIAWRREAQLDSKFQQYYPENDIDVWLTAGKSLFPDTIVMDRINEVKDIKTVLEDPSMGLRVWFPPESDQVYVIGGDPAGGHEGGDFNTAQILSASTMQQCAVVRGHWSPDEYASILGTMGKWFNLALIGIEANNIHGTATMAYMLDARYPNLYWQIDRTSPVPKKAGWYTTKWTREEMLNDLLMMLNEYRLDLYDTLTLGELRTFIEKEDGKAGASRGSHDDLVMALAIAVQMLKYARRDRAKRKTYVVRDRIASPGR